ncbi:Unknown protein, partial [Striga hermonthica]
IKSASTRAVDRRGRTRARHSPWREVIREFVDVGRACMDTDSRRRAAFRVCASCGGRRAWGMWLSTSRIDPRARECGMGELRVVFSTSPPFPRVRGMRGVAVVRALNRAKESARSRLGMCAWLAAACVRGVVESGASTRVSLIPSTLTNSFRELLFPNEVSGRDDLGLTSRGFPEFSRPVSQAHYPNPRMARNKRSLIRTSSRTHFLFSFSFFFVGRGTQGYITITIHNHLNSIEMYHKCIDNTFTTITHVHVKAQKSDLKVLVDPRHGPTQRTPLYATHNRLSAFAVTRYLQTQIPVKTQICGTPGKTCLKHTSRTQISQYDYSGKSSNPSTTNIMKVRKYKSKSRRAFVAGLRFDLAAEVRLERSDTMHNAMEVARRREDHLDATRRGRADMRYTDTRRTGPNPATAGTRPSVGNRPAGSIVRRLSPEEVKRRREKGLCFKCEERFTPGHQCKQAFVIEVANPDEEGSENEEEPHQDIVVEGPDEEAEISMHAMAGIRGPRTMRLPAWVKDRKVVVLVDNGSSHNFINAE